jgi:hypothetical protein
MNLLTRALFYFSIVCAVALVRIAAAPQATTRTFNTPQEAAEALVAAAEHFDVPRWKRSSDPTATTLLSPMSRFAIRNTRKHLSLKRTRK